MSNLQFNRYYTHAELTTILHDIAKAHPDLVQIESIGLSHEGKEIWLLTVTDISTGAHNTKPALWCDGNIHASELSASTAVLKVLHKLITEKPDILKTRTFYLVPRLGPDGADWALESPPRIVRSGTRKYPYPDQDPYGLERQDIDGDNRILSMRVKDENGPWKISPQEPRLMVKRQPDDTQGPFYRLLPEGTFHNFDGLTLRGHRQDQGLDFNRNFPGGWRPESEQHGAGPFPTSEPEIRAAVQAITDRPNICGGIAFHTFSGVVLRIPGHKPEDDLPAEDVWTAKALGQKATDISGYPCISTYHDFRYHPKEVITGVFDDWLYDHLGVYGWIVEIWSPQTKAGIEEYKPIDWYRDHPFEDDLKMLKWSDETLQGKGYIDWYPFNHPQLGEVELGGWDSLYAFRNPPLNFLEEEVTPLADWAIFMAHATPCLEIKEILTENHGDTTHIRAVIQNTGHLPTNVTKHAAEKNLTRSVQAQITVQGENRDPKGKSTPDWLITGKLTQDLGQLTGRDQTPSSAFGWNLDANTNLTIAEWVVKSGQTYTISATHQRAGTQTKTINT